MVSRAYPFPLTTGFCFSHFIERDSFGRPYIQDETDAGAIIYDTGVLLTVKEI